MASSERQDAPGENTRAIHRETGSAWEILAKAWYGGNVEEQVKFLRDGGAYLSPPEIALLGDLRAWCRRVINLQCSGGKEALSLWKLGAQEIVGVDISGSVLGRARKKGEALGAPATWYCCDILDTPHELDGTADLVYTGGGALIWMLDLDAWASVVHRLLKPGGRVFVCEFHPLDNVWEKDAPVFRLRQDGIGYFQPEPYEDPGFPAQAVARETGQDPNRPRVRMRVWRPGELMNALSAKGFQYMHYDEYPDVGWPDWRETIPADAVRRLPHIYTVMMRRP